MKRNVLGCVAVLLAGLFTLPAWGQIEVRVGTAVVPEGGVYNFGTFAVGTDTTRRVTLVNVGSSDVDLSNVLSFHHPDDPGRFVISNSDLPLLAPGESGGFDATFQSTGAGTVTNNVVISTHNNGGTYRLTLRATATVPTPRLLVQHAGTSISPNAVVHLGPTALGEAILSDFKFRNTGTAPLTVHGVTWSGQEVSFATTPPSVVPTNDIRTFTLRFAASTPGNHSAAISIATNDASNPVYRFTMTWAVTDSRDFSLQAGPPSREVQPGGRAFYTVSANPIDGFDAPVTLSASGMPAGVLVNFTPQTVQPGEVSEVRVNTAFYTLAGTYPLTFSGTGGGITRTASVDVVVHDGQASGPPVIDQISPQVLVHANGQVVTITGQNFQGSTVTIPRGSPDPSIPVTRTFPSVTLDSISSDGTSMRVRINSANPEILDFYNLLLDNGQGADAMYFRVVPTTAPLVDTWTPSEPARGEAYVLSLVGQNLRHATVSPSHSGRVRIFGVDNGRQDRLNAVMEVLPNASLGPIQLIVRGPSGQSISLPITIHQTINGPALISRDIVAYQNAGQPTRSAASPSPAPKLFLQDFVMRETGATVVQDGNAVVLHPTLAPATRDPTRFDPAPIEGPGGGGGGGGGGSIPRICSYSFNIASYYWQVGLVFDPDTGKFSDTSVQGLNVGDRATVGALVLSFFVDVELTVYFRCDPGGWSFPQFCLSIVSGTEIPGHSGFAYSIDFCFGGSFDESTQGETETLRVEGGPCARIEDQNQPTGGLVYATVEQLDCCPQQLDITASGTTFSDTFFGRTFDVDTSDAGTTTPGDLCTPGTGNCSIIFVNEPACVVKNKQRVLAVQATPEGGDYSWRVVQGAGRVSFLGPTDQAAAVVQANNLSNFADDVHVEVTYSDGNNYECKRQVNLSVIEVTNVRWRGQGNLDSMNDPPFNAILGTPGYQSPWGLPQLGHISPGNPVGAVGLNKNMEIKATIQPCDPNLRCAFDFKRERNGSHLFVEVVDANSSTINELPFHDPGNWRDDDSHNNDEDLILDGPSGCGVFSQDIPGFAFVQCDANSPIHNNHHVHCFNFREWLNVDGVAVTPSTLWYASSAAYCDDKWYFSPIGQGNQLGLGQIDCSLAGVIAAPTPSQPRPTRDVGFEPDFDVQRLTAMLQASDGETRLRAMARIREWQREEDGTGEDRDTLVSFLVQLAAETGQESEMFSGSLLAIQLLGDLQATEGIPVLMSRVEDDFERVLTAGLEDVPPTALALAKIGPAIIDPILDRAGSAPRTEWEPLVHALRRLEDPADLEEALELRWRDATARELKRFEALDTP